MVTQNIGENFVGITKYLENERKMYKENIWLQTKQTQLLMDSRTFKSNIENSFDLNSTPLRHVEGSLQ